MKIGIAVSKLTLSGGMERYSLDLISALNTRGIKPYVFMRKYDHELLNNYQFTPVIVSVSKLWGKLGIHIFSLKLKYLKKKYGINWMFGCNRNEHSEIAICGGTHLGYLAASNKQQNYWDRKEIKLEKRLYLNAKVIVAHSLRMQQELISFYHIEPQKIKVIYPPINDDIFRPISKEKRDAIRTSNGWQENETILLFPSSGHVRKGLPYIIEQFSKLTQSERIKLVVLGKSDKVRNVPNIIFKPFTNNIQSLYQAADFTILASSYEPFGLVGPESVLCGTPCIFSTVIGATEVLDSKVCHTFDLEENNSLVPILQNIENFKLRIEQPQYHINYSVNRTEHLDAVFQACGIVS